MEIKRIFGIRILIFILAILAFLSDTSNSITYVTVPLLALRLGASYEFIGTMVALSALTRLLLVQPIGWLCDRKDNRIFLSLGFVLFFANFLILIFANSPFHILIGRILQGAGSAMFYTSAISLLLVNTDENRGFAVGLYATLMGLGFSIGPIIGGFIAENISYDASYALSSAMAIIAFFLVIFGVKYGKKEIIEKSESLLNIEDTSFKSLLKNKNLLIACIGAFFISEAIGADTSFFPVFGKDLSLTESVIGTMLGIRALLSTIVRIPVGKIADRIGSRELMMTSLALSATGLLLIPQFRVVWLFPIFLGLEGIGYGSFLTSANTYIGEITSEKNKGAAVGLYNTMSGIGSVLNMTILGYIAGNFGVENTFRFTSIMCFIGLAINIILSKSS